VSRPHDDADEPLTTRERWRVLIAPVEPEQA